MKCVRLIEAEDGPGVRVLLWDGKKETEAELFIYSPVALMRMTDTRFRRQPRPAVPETMKDESFGDPVRQKRSEDSRLLYG